jgi:hypothetical protein
MPLTKVAFRSGVQKDDSPLSSEGGWVDADKVRFVRGQPQTIGGWDAATSSTFTGIARGGHAWADISGRRWLAWGTATKLYVFAGGAIRDITPVLSQGVLASPFTTTSGSPTVQVTHANHGLATGQSVTYSNQSATVGGLTLNGSFPVTVTSTGAYTITAGSNASSSVTGGGNVDYSYPLASGLVDGIGEPGGYGTGSYSEGGYGSTIISAASLPRVWSLDNFGQNLLAVPRGGPLFEFQTDATYGELTTSGDFSSSAAWTAGTGWSVGSGVATAVAGSGSDLSQAVALTAGKVYRVRFTVTRSAGTLTFKTNGSALSGGASSAITVSGTYDRLFRATVGSTQIVFTKDAAFAGTLDNVQVNVADIAYRVDEAPAVNDAMFVDPNRIVVLIGTSFAGSTTYNQLVVRWSDAADVTAWTPTTANLAGDTLLSVGGRAVGGLATRLQNLVWTDTALYTMQYTGDADQPFVFRLAGTSCGLIGPLAAAEHNGIVFWMGRDNCFVFQGSSPAVIPSTLRRDLFDNLAEAQQEKVVAGANSAFSEVWWFYPDARDGNECSRYVAFQFDEGHWTCGTFARSTWVPAGVFPNPIALGTDGYIYYHERGQSAGGGAITSFVDGAYYDIDDGETLAHIRRLVPDFEGQTGPVNLSLYYKPWPNASETLKGTYIAAANTNKIDLRLTARQIRFRVGAAAAPSFWRFGSLRFDIMRTGQRR